MNGVEHDRGCRRFIKWGSNGRIRYEPLAGMLKVLLCNRDCAIAGNCRREVLNVRRRLVPSRDDHTAAIGTVRENNLAGINANATIHLVEAVILDSEIVG